jgi:hypothetical protein
MRNHKLLTIAAAGIAIILPGWLPAVAAPDLTYNGASVYKDTKDNVYYVTTTLKSDITYDNVDVIKAPYSDACGFTRLNLNNNTTPSFPTTITFNGSSDTLGSIPIVTEKNPYKCVNGVAQWKSTAQTSVFQTSVTTNSLISKNIYYPPSRTGGASKQGLISYTASLTKLVNPNACGFFVTPGYANSQKKTSGTLSINGSSINIASLPINPSPPECVGGKASIGSATNVATFNGATLYRTTKNIYFTGLTPKSLNVVGYDALKNKSYDPYLSSCGLFRVGYTNAATPAVIKIGATRYTPATMQDRNAPLDCSSYAMLDTLYKYPNNGGSTFYYKTTDPNQKKLAIETPATATTNIAVNACGFAVIPALNTVSGFTTGDKVTINGSAPYDVTTLPLATEAPTCKNGAVYLVSP